MRINLVTLFPEWFSSPLDAALLGRARGEGLLDVRLYNPRDEATDRHKSVDDRPYGGGPGMVMLLEPLVRTLRRLRAEAGPSRTVILSASGRPFTQALAAELALEPQLTLVCGRYEGIDARLGEVAEIGPVDEISVGEAVLNGGEAAAMLVVEAASRLLPGFMGKEASGEDESFSQGLLEYPHYTRPEMYEEKPVPRVLLSGDHGRIARWRREESLRRTWIKRPDMIDEAPVDADDMAFVRELACGATEAAGRRLGRHLHCALVHYPVWLGDGTCGATSLTNLDVHDIARCSRSYGLAAFHVITPLREQVAILETLRGHWAEGAGARNNPDRAEALRLVEHSPDLAAAVEAVRTASGKQPFVVGTSAQIDAGRRKSGRQTPLTPGQVRALLDEVPVLLLFGTGHGLAPEALELCDGVMRPLRWMDMYNHLPVRGAVAITLDRILGDRC